MSFWRNATVLNQYVRAVLADLPNVFCWRHPEFNNPHNDFYLADGVNLNPSGQYLRYRSYRGGSSKLSVFFSLASFLWPQKHFCQLYNSVFLLSDIIDIIACKKALKWGMKKRRERTRIKGEGGERRLFKPSAFPADLFTNIGERTAGTERVFPQK